MSSSAAHALDRTEEAEEVDRMMRTIAGVVISCSLLSAQAAKAPSPLQVKTLLQTEKAWDDKPYDSYPAGRPQLSVLEITIPPHTTMEWHRHLIPNAAYVVAGDLKVEKQNGQTAHFGKGQVIAETVGEWHRGVTGERAVELLVFYAGAKGLPLSEAQSKAEKPAK
jgi:quercetin dioxygenase-like cupin family protein